MDGAEEVLSRRAYMEGRFYTIAVNPRQHRRLLLDSIVMVSARSIVSLLVSWRALRGPRVSAVSAYSRAQALPVRRAAPPPGGDGGMLAAGPAGRAQRPYRELRDECSIFGRWSACSADSRPPQPRRHSHPSSSAALCARRVRAKNSTPAPSRPRFENPSLRINA